MTGDQIVIILAALLAVSEALAIIPAVKANSVFQLIFGILGKAIAIFKKG